MIRRNKIIASVAVSVMTGVLVAGNLAPLQGYYAFAQETGVKTARYSAVKDINKTLEGYTPIDSSDPVEFGGTYIKYQGETIQLSETAIYLDGSLSDELAAQYPYVYNDITKALSADALKNGTADKPMTVYVAPYVYWIDDRQQQIQSRKQKDIQYLMEWLLIQIILLSKVLQEILIMLY